MTAFAPKLVPCTLLLSLALVLKPYLLDIAWGAILAILAYPFALKLHSKTSYSWTASSLITLLSLCTLFATPLITLASQLHHEIKSLQTFLEDANASGIPIPDIFKNIPLLSQPISDWWLENLARPNQLFPLLKSIALSEHSTHFYSASASAIASASFHLIIASICAIVLLVNAPFLKSAIPSTLSQLLPAHQASTLSRVTPQAFSSVAFGLGAIALLEGFLLGIAYHLAGAPFPLILAIISAYAALIPGGAPLAFSCVSLIVLSQGHPSHALALFSWGAFELFLVDKFIRPKLIGQSLHMPFLPTFLSLIGGVTTLGPIGLFIAPAITAILLSLLRQNQTPSTLA